MEDILPEEEQYYENNSTNKFRNADYKIARKRKYCL